MDHKGLQQGNDTMLHSWSFPVAPYPSSHAMCRLSNFDIAMSHANTRTQDPSPLNADRKTPSFFFFFFKPHRKKHSVYLRTAESKHTVTGTKLTVMCSLACVIVLCVCLCVLSTELQGRAPGTDGQLAA